MNVVYKVSIFIWILSILTEYLLRRWWFWALLLMYVFHSLVRRNLSVVTKYGSLSGRFLCRQLVGVVRFLKKVFIG